MYVRMYANVLLTNDIYLQQLDDNLTVIIHNHTIYNYYL